MSPRAASRLESLGFRKVHDYAAGKMDWFAAGLPMEGEAAREVHIGQLARGDAPSCTLEDRLGEVRTRVESAGRDQAVVLDQRRVLLGRLSRDALSADPSAEVAAAAPGSTDSGTPAPSRHRTEVRSATIACSHAPAGGLECPSCLVDPGSAQPGHAGGVGRWFNRVDSLREARSDA
jgi:hypothetical protein